MIVKRTDNSQQSLILKIDNDGILQVEAPQRISVETIVAYLNKNANWLTKQLSTSGEQYKSMGDANIHNKNLHGNQNQRNSNLKTEKKYNTEHEQQIANQIANLFSCRSCILCGKLIDIKGGSVKKISINDKTILLPEKIFDDKQQRIKAVKAYIKKIATQFLAQEISKFGCSVSLCPTKIEIKAIKGADWIDCSAVAERKIVIDYRVIQLPVRLQKYVIIHAFSHFFENGHTTEFWNILSNYLPMYHNNIAELDSFRFIKDI